MPARMDGALYPKLEPFRSGSLDVGDGHFIYWEQAGAAAGKPLVILHGGPGGGVNPYYRQLFDPERWCATLFEQRGCGRSKPHGELAHNTTAHLVADIEALRKSLGVERWVVLGGSWGSTLALAYAEEHPESCAGLIVTGVFLARQQDRAWWWEGARHIFPEVWQELSDFLPPEERSDLRSAYLRRILDSNPETHRPALRAMLTYETQILDLGSNPARLEALLASDNLEPMGRLYAHYDKNLHFLEENQLLGRAHRLAGVPGWIVQGRYDVCTPPSGAYDLWRAWPAAKFRLVGNAAHAWNDPNLCQGVREALTDAWSSAVWPDA